MLLLQLIGLAAQIDPHQDRSNPTRGSADRLWIAAILLALHSVSFGASVPLQPLESIRQAAVEYIQAQQGYYPSPPIIHAGRLDPRLRLPRCEQPLTTFLPTGGRNIGNITVGVRCDGQITWSLFVPVRVRVMANVLVTTQPIARGKLITNADLQLQERDIATLPHGYYYTKEKALGKKVKRSLPQGSVLNPRQLESLKMVKRGDMVTILAQSSGFTVRMRGKAMGHGAKGDKIQIRNLSSKRVVEGVVISAGVVEISM